MVGGGGEARIVCGQEEWETRGYRPCVQISDEGGNDETPTYAGQKMGLWATALMGEMLLCCSSAKREVAHRRRKPSPLLDCSIHGDGRS